MHTDNAFSKPAVGQRAKNLLSKVPPAPGQLPNYHASSFSGPKDLNAHIKKPAWKPTAGVYGGPITHLDLELYTSKVYNALVNIQEVWDKDDCPIHFEKFHAGGDCSNPRDLEATAILLVNQCIKIHRDGLTGFMFQRASSAPPHQYDIELTFPQRIHWVAFLLEHYKQHAFRVMCQLGVDSYLGCIWTFLMSQKQFNTWIRSLPTHERHFCLNEVPYAGITSNNLPVMHPIAFLNERRRMRDHQVATATPVTTSQAQQLPNLSYRKTQNTESPVKQPESTHKSGVEPSNSQTAEKSARAIKYYSHQLHVQLLKDHPELRKEENAPEVQTGQSSHPEFTQEELNFTGEFNEELFEEFLKELDETKQI